MSQEPRSRPGKRFPRASLSVVSMFAVLSLQAACGGAPEAASGSGPRADWPEWGGDAGATHWSPLTQIDRGNVGRLEVAWTHATDDYHDGSGRSGLTAFQATPIVVNDTLYYCTPFSRVFALDPATGEERWSFDPQLRAIHSVGPYPLSCRGVTYWEEASPIAGRACQKRIFLGTKDSELIALDADTGLPCEGFGEGGRKALREGLTEAEAWEYYPTSPPLAIGDRLVIGALVADNHRVDVPSGVVRAFDVRTGELAWAWDPVPPGWTWTPPPGSDATWAPGSPNVWSIITADRERGLVFVPTGNPSPDIYGGNRQGIDRYGSSTVALDARTGERVWHFQSVHHDVWDYDVPSSPVLFQSPGVGGGVPAVAQTTKMGFVFLLDRLTGEPLYPVEERAVPQHGAAPGETLAPTQPFPTHPPPLHPDRLGEDDVWGFTKVDRAACAALVREHRWDGFFTPPGLDAAIQYPHTSGGMNWGGVALDAARGLLIVNQNHVAMTVQLVRREEAERIDASEVAYPIEFYPMTGTPYAVKRAPLFSPLGAPCNPPPWGTLTAVDLRSGTVRWSIPFGSTRGLAPDPVWIEMGAPNFGGGIATAGGLYFVGATLDQYFHAYDVDTGELLFEQRMPYPGNAVPMTYRTKKPGAEGRQFVVMAAGGNPLGRMGATLIAFALPEKAVAASD